MTTARLFRLSRLLLPGLMTGALLFCSTPARAQTDPGAPFVDLQQVLAAYKKTTAFTAYQQRLRDHAVQYAEEMKVLAQFRYCTGEERKEALALKARAKPSAQEASRLAELAKKADQIDNELLALSRKEKPTDPEKKRLQQLYQMRTEAIRTLAEEDANRREKLRKLESDLLTEVENELLKLVQSVAKEYNLPTIYERRAVLSGGADLTILVIKKLPK